MMNRSVMGRQMFAKGGAAFPDISGDGQVTQKDILMGRGVIPRPMQEGGIADPMMMQGMDPSMVPQEDPMMAQQGEVDPEVLAGMFGQMETQMAGIEDSEDLEGMMNAVRGDEQPIEARRAELAGLVGPEDAQVTPESVLALVQPVMQLASLDQGIGGLAEAEMSGVSMEGPMSEGIMSTVNTAPDAAPMPPPTGQAMMDPAMMGVGNPPPVNFRQGGVVQYMEDGGSPIQDAYNERAFYDELIKDYTVDDQAMLDDRKQMAKSQMFFDLAQAGLEFASPGQRQESPAESLARAFKNTDFFPKLGARGQAIQDLKDKQTLSRRAASQSLMPSRLAASEAQVAADRAAQAALKKAQITAAEKGSTNIMIPGMKATLKSVPKSQVPLYSGLGYALATNLSSSGDDSKRANFRKPSGEVVTAEVGTPLYYQYLNVDMYPETGPAKQPSATERAAQIQNFAMIDDPTKVMRLDLSKDTDRAILDALDPMKWVKAGSQSLAGPDKKPKLSPASQILADPSLSMPYKNNSASPEDKALFEQAIIEFTSGGQVFNFETGRYEKVAAKELTPDLRETLKEGNPKLFTQITGVSLDSSGKEVVRNLMTANIELINPDGTLNTKSPIWDTTAPNRFDPEINYKLAIGGSRVLPSTVGVVTEIGQEVFGMDPSPETIKFKKAQKSLNGLANDLLQYATGDQDGRVLKFVQELIEQETSDIRPGGLLFKTDADAKGSLDNLADGLKQAFQINAAKLPEYTPDAANRYSAAIIQATSQDQQKLKVLLNEVLKFQEFFASGLPTTGAGTSANKKSLIQMAQ